MLGYSNIIRSLPYCSLKSLFKYLFLLYQATYIAILSLYRDNCKELMLYLVLHRHVCDSHSKL